MSDQLQWEDPIVAEVRAIREACAAQYGFDLDALYQALKKEEQQSDRPTVSFPPRPAMVITRKRKTPLPVA
jgi:hypothetical protein